ncbi:MAG TPA: VOC family protein [Bacteroidota bacterium]
MNNETFTLPAQTHIENVHLRVRSLNETLLFYKDMLGFREIRRKGSTVFLSASEKKPARVVLTELPDAKPRSQRSPGLFHTAILYPSRKELARTFVRLYEHQAMFQGFANHGVSEALYLADPEGNGVELYADRPRELWQYANGELTMITEQLDIESLVAELDGKKDEWAGIHPETRIGHVHLQVSDISKAEQFYHRTLGFSVTQRSYPGALFVSAGGYHHHLGFNVWNSRQSAPAPPDALGLQSFRIRVHGQGTLDVLKKRLSEAGIKIEQNNGVLRVWDSDGIGVELFDEDGNSN